MARDIPTPQIVQPVAMTGMPRSIRAAFTSAADTVSGAIDTVLGVGMMASVLLNFANVLCRHVFGIALVGADELLVYGMVATIFLGAVSVTWRGAHLRLDVLLDAMPQPVREPARRAADLVMMLLCGIVAFAAVGMAHEMARFDQRSLAAGLPMVLPHGAVALGMTLIAILAGLRAVGIRPQAQDDNRGEPA